MSRHLTRRGRLVETFGLVLLGTGFGIVVSAVNHGFGPASAYVSKVIGDGWVWLAAGLGACLLGRGWRQSWVRGVMFFWPAVVGYYAADTAAGVYSSPPFADPTAPARLDLRALVADTVGYLVVAAVTSALLALVVLLARRGGVVGLLAAMAVPSSIAYAALTLHHDLRRLPSALDDPITSAVTGYLGLGALAAAALVLVVRLRRLVGTARPLSRAPDGGSAG